MNEMNKDRFKTSRTTGVLP